MKIFNCSFYVLNWRQRFYSFIISFFRLGWSQHSNKIFVVFSELLFWNGCRYEFGWGNSLLFLHRETCQSVGHIGLSQLLMTKILESKITQRFAGILVNKFLYFPFNLTTRKDFDQEITKRFAKILESFFFTDSRKYLKENTSLSPSTQRFAKGCLKKFPPAEKKARADSHLQKFAD